MLLPRASRWLSDVSVRGLVYLYVVCAPILHGDHDDSLVRIATSRLGETEVLAIFICYPRELALGQNFRLIRREDSDAFYLAS